MRDYYDECMIGQLRERIAELEATMAMIEDSLISYEPEHAADHVRHIVSILKNFRERKP